MMTLLWMAWVLTIGLMLRGVFLFMLVTAVAMQAFSNLIVEVLW